MKLAYRISPGQLETDEQFSLLLDFLDEHRHAVDELSLFTERWHHGYFPLDQFARRAELLGRRMGQFRKKGFTSVGINMLCTLGHLDEAWDYLEKLPFQAAVGHDGRISRSCACANTKEFRAYIAEKYRLVAKQNPDFIWVDDDIRMDGRGVSFACFCPTCLGLFGKRNGLGALDREQLVARLNMEPNEALRRNWIAFNKESLEELLRLIRTVVNETDSRVELGLMAVAASAGGGVHSYASGDFSRFLDLLGAKRFRPGGGFYGDESPWGMVPKSMLIAEQCATVTSPDRQYELENFPHQKFGKSVRIVLDECALALISGCNGIAFNALKDLPGPLDDYEDLMKGIAAERLRWTALVEASAGTRPAGFWCAHGGEIMATRQVQKGDWFGPTTDYEVRNMASLSQIGLPLSASRENACGALLSGRLAETFSDEQLLDILKSGVLMDTKALAVLGERKLGHLAGVRPGKSHGSGVFEQFTDHPLNGRYAGDGRDVRASFWNETAEELVPIDSRIIRLAEFISYDGGAQGLCMSAYENELGGRVAVLGYSPWSRLGTGAKRWQILEVADWVSRQALPLRIEPAVRVAPFVRRSADGARMVTVLLNAGFDAIPSFKIQWRSKLKQISIVNPDGGLQELDKQIQASQTHVIIKDLQPWHYAVVVGNE